MPNIKEQMKDEQLIDILVPIKISAKIINVTNDEQQGELYVRVDMRQTARNDIHDTIANAMNKAIAKRIDGNEYTLKETVNNAGSMRISPPDTYIYTKR